ncbi:hypothetical protein C8N46_102306 [Kordia periserrulae]|uniref:Tetratricopeptide repeat protein n=1 Tax=Kordia periserrulae TaxID=701523 RepID=A0A2T6C3M8_9FLAO|nr:hypothetical protein [Kordia periserrulae]PTX62905.1 hypothetical protein C8N46_102306 [Kordia periserrulae]
MKKCISCLLFLYSFLLFSQETNESYIKNTDENDKKVIALGEALSASFYEEELSSFFIDNFDIESFAKKALSINEKVNESNALDEFNNTFGKDYFLERFEQFPETIRADIENGASYSIVNFYYHLDEKKYHLLFRLFTEGEGINYHDYQLGYKDDKFVLQDVFVYFTGQYFSETYKDLYSLTIPSDDVEANKNRLKSLLFFRLYRNLIAKKKYKEIFALLNTLEGEFTTKKIYYITKIKIATQINEVFQLEAIDELLKAFPNDIASRLMAVDYYIMLKDYNTTMLLLDDLQATTEDLFIEYIRANVAWEFEDYELAEKAYATTIKEYPDFENAKLNLLYLYDFLEKHEDNIVLLNSMIESEEYLKKDLIDFIDDSENEFINLPKARIYNKWKKQK